MKKIFLPVVSCFISILSFSQQTAWLDGQKDKYNEAKEYFQKEQYNLAYPLLKELQQSLQETDRINNSLVSQEIAYYATVCGLMQHEARAEQDARDFITIEKNNPRVQMMSFHLAEYYFREQQFADAAGLYENVSLANLDNRQVADMKFHQGYSYFTMQRFADAKPLLNAIRQVPDDPNYIDANYYYGFIAFRDRNFTDAL